MNQSILDFVLNSKEFEEVKAEYAMHNLTILPNEITQVSLEGYSKEDFKSAKGALIYFYFENFHSVDDNGSYLEPKYISLPIGHKTPKGYFSTKFINVEVADTENLTETEILNLMEFYTDAKKNTFDPFYHENEARRRNASAWNYIATHYITDPYCTR
jgi:hypothetical protein